jgi:glycosyltransferase involved in cell wall biosynthesis
MTRVLMLGPVDSPHLAAMALAMHERGHEVMAAGHSTPSMPSLGLEEAGIAVLAAGDRPRKLGSNVDRYADWLRELVREARPDIVHAHWFHVYPYIAAAAGVSPFLATPWGSDVYLRQEVREKANRVAAETAAAVTEHTPAMRRRMLELGADPERLAHIRWGVDLSRFEPPGDRAAERAALGFGEGPLVLSPRGYGDVYNVGVLLEAFDLLADRHPDVQLALMGPRAEKPTLPDLRHADRVRVVEWVPYEQVARYLGVADACVSIPSSDGSPNAVWEAMACGCPCVVSDLPWLEGMIERDADALVVPIDAEETALALERLLGDPALARQLATRGRSLVEREHDRRVHMDRLSALYDELAGMA